MWLPTAPTLAALAAALVGLINIASALTPNIRWRGHLLLSFEPVERVRLFHALALPAGAALLLVAPYLLKRRRRAWQVAVVLMLVARRARPAQGPGLRGDGCHLGWPPRLLCRGRRAFTVRHDPITLRSAIWRVPLLGAVGLALAGARHLGLAGPPLGGARWCARPATCCAWHARPDPLPHAAVHHRARWIPLSVHLIEIGTLLAIAYVIFRPLAAPARAARARPRAGRRRAGPRATATTRCRSSSCAPTSTTSSATTAAPSSATGSRTACCCSPATRSARRSASRDLLGRAARVRRSRGLKLGAVGASERLCPLYEELGLRTIYLGDEAIIELDALLAPGPADPQGPPVGHPPEQGRLHAPSCTRSPRSTPATIAEVEHGARARPRGRARARLLDGDGLARAPIRRRHAGRAGPRRRPARGPRRPALRARATGARRCRCRSCAATPARPTG